MLASEVLSRSRYFRGMDRDLVRTLLAQAEHRSFQRNQPLWREGEQSSRLCFVTEGRLKLVKHRASGKDLIVDILGPGKMWGFLDTPTHEQPVSVVGLAQGSLATIDRAVFMDCLRHHSGMALNVALTQMQEYQSLLERFEEVTAGNVETRLASLFLRLASEEGETTPQGVVLELPLSRQDLADLVDTTIETAIRIMSRWNRDQLVLTQRSGFLIPSVDELELRVE